MKDRKFKASLIINIVNSVLFAVIFVLMMLDIKFMGDFGRLTPTTTTAFQFFTVDSNILLFLANVLFIVYQILFLKGKIQNIPRFVYLIKFVATVSTGLTFFMVVFVLAPQGGSEWWRLFVNHNLAYHFLCPVLGLVAFMFFERFEPFNFKETLFGLIPMFIYSIYYVINILVHYEGGAVSTDYDWYRFAQGGVPSMILFSVLSYAMTFGISVMVWLPNHLSLKKRKEKDL